MFDITLMTDHFQYHGQCVDIESIAQLLLVHDNKIILYFYNPDFFVQQILHMVGQQYMMKMELKPSSEANIYTVKPD